MRVIPVSLFVVLLLILCGLALISGVFTLALRDVDKAYAGTPVYWLKIPAEARNFPLWEPCGRAKFSYRFQDGLSPETFWIDYDSRESEDILRQRFGGRLAPATCSQARPILPGSNPANGTTSLVCREKAQTVRLDTMSEAAGCRPVRITFERSL